VRVLDCGDAVWTLATAKDHVHLGWVARIKGIAD
jgi:hypothetical protein